MDCCSVNGGTGNGRLETISTERPGCAADTEYWFQFIARSVSPSHFMINGLISDTTTACSDAQNFPLA